MIDNDNEKTQIRIVLTHDEKTEIKAAARSNGLTMSGYLRWLHKQFLRGETRND